MLAKIQVENPGRFFGDDGPICEHSTCESRSDPLQQLRSALFQESRQKPRQALLLLVLATLLVRSACGPGAIYVQSSYL
jgi:hypothetical protein